VKIALIGDIHANLPALKAVLAHARKQGAEAIWNVGDFVGYNAYPDAVVRLIRRRRVVSISGNHDLKVLKVPSKRHRWTKTKPAKKLLALQWAYDHLSVASRRYLRGLARKLRIKVEGLRVLLTHGSPDFLEEHLRPNTPGSRLRKLARRAKADVIICGHSHQAFVRHVDGVWFINTGSVGRQGDGNPRACYAIMTIQDQKVQVRHFRLRYDVAAAAAAIRRAHLPEEFAQMIIKGRKLKDVEKAR
jgi:putative phosphoesterase